MKPRVLYVTHRVPWPPDRGDRIRTWNILKYLAARADVDLICMADEPVSSETEAALKNVTRNLAIIPHEGKMRWVRGALSMLGGRTVTEGLFANKLVRQTINAWALQYDYTATLASSSGVARYLQVPSLADVLHPWIDLIDVDSQKWLDYADAARFPMSLVYRQEGLRLRELEKRLAEKSERMLVVSEAERDLFRKFAPSAPIQAIGNGVDTEYFMPVADEVTAFSCVFVGVLNYLPNSDAVRWFCDHVWPKVLTKYPQAVFRIVGKSPPPEVEALGQRDGVEVIGPVPDVRPWLRQSTAVVVPLRIARGVQNKVLEAMACGRPIVCSTEPLKGLDIESGLQLLQADDPHEWVQQIETVFTDSIRAQELGMAASAWVELNHRWESCLEPLNDLVCRTALRSDREVEVG